MSDKPQTTALVARVAKAIRQAVHDHDIDDHALYMMGDLTDDWTGQEAANLIAVAIVKELEVTHPPDLHALSVEVGQLMQEVRDLKNECKRHAGNVIEAHAYAVKCDRHLPKMRGCAWIDNRPCECRSSVTIHFPEYADAR